MKTILKMKTALEIKDDPKNEDDLEMKIASKNEET